MNKIQRIKELIEKIQVQIELFQAIQRQEESFIHQNAIDTLKDSKRILTKYLEEFSDEEFWTCCGGKKLTHTESCPVCGDKYEESVNENQ